MMDSWKLIVVLLAGIPHGAADVQLALRSGTTRNSTVFFFLYLGLALLTFWAWFLFPMPLTVLFFLVSAWHFGESDAPQKHWPVKLGIGIWHFLLFGLLHWKQWGQQFPEALSAIDSITATESLALSFSFLVLGWFLWERTGVLAGSLFFMHLVGAFFSFEVHFLFYFLWWHTPLALHFARKTLSKAWIPFLLALLPLSLLAWFMLGALFALAPEGSGLWWMFGGVVALTFPHTLLFHKLFENHRLQEASPSLQRSPEDSFEQLAVGFLEHEDGKSR